VAGDEAAQTGKSDAEMLGCPFPPPVGVSLNGGTPISHPKMMIFSRKTPWLLGTTILGNLYMDIVLLSSNHEGIRQPSSIDATDTHT